jgi:hypothetical protein
MITSKSNASLLLISLIASFTTTHTHEYPRNANDFSNQRHVEARQRSGEYIWQAISGMRGLIARGRGGLVSCLTVNLKEIRMVQRTVKRHSHLNFLEGVAQSCQRSPGLKFSLWPYRSI